ncbi:hypothetical protein CFK38_03615 [Brachybacterium vulturis]|uniref:Uncharacterized protein n=1 Tax=Brachybacterium vulturis TaxID=2017484 RepID=A0A291GKI3_9MICO|nr:hypothetical protein [Brachybacterium vulturis]ATG50707.1 hypothetical protein CFK38_03615 [Brachybacterium vulturis]
MKTDPSGPRNTPVPPPTAGEARTALDALDEDASQLAGRLVSPWWYHLVLGVIVAAAIGAQALPTVPSVSVIMLVVLWIPVLMRSYTSRYRISMTRPAGPRSRRMLLLILAVLALLVASGVVLKIASLPQWWVLLPAGVGVVATVLLGRRYDAVLRSEVAHPHRPSEPR